MKIIGMYIHQHWPYKYPYAARTWEISDWRGYLDGLKKLGYNTVQIWPMLETIPNPLTASDLEHLQKMTQVIDIAHKEFGMLVFVVLCPNIAANNEKACQSSFQERHYFQCDINVNPANKDEVAKMIAWREYLFSFLKEADGVPIIDSDPGGYPDSTNDEYVHILLEHRKMFDRLRPGIELVLWLHVGWNKFCRFYKTGHIDWKNLNNSDFEEVLLKIKDASPEPWGIANGMPSARELGLESRVISFSYGAIEAEPSFPLTNFGPFRGAYEAGKKQLSRGVMGNAQTHCLQLPNTFAFVQGALAKEITRDSYINFAERLIPGLGMPIVECWEALGQTNSEKMRIASEKLNRLAVPNVKSGDLGGLLFNDPQRFLTDLLIQLRYKAAYEEFCEACEKNRFNKNVFRTYIEALEIWQNRHGYKSDWAWYDTDNQRFAAALKTLNSEYIEQVMSPICTSKTPFEQVKEKYLINETFTPRFIEAMKQTLNRMSS
ncbi:MAG: hypothetical protein WCW64_09620 [Phycisphaerae bacterium]|jgi:hypothetical protein